MAGCEDGQEGARRPAWRSLKPRHRACVSIRGRLLRPLKVVPYGLLEIWMMWAPRCSTPSAPVNRRSKGWLVGTQHLGQDGEGRVHLRVAVRLGAHDSGVDACWMPDQAPTSRPTPPQPGRRVDRAAEDLAECGGELAPRILGRARRAPADEAVWPGDPSIARSGRRRRRGRRRRCDGHRDRTFGPGRGPVRRRACACSAGSPLS